MNIKRPDISIIVPVYNVEKYLRRCIESILSQTLKNYEVILINDGSSDSSGKICDEYVAKYDNFKVIHKKNAGLGYARNSGLEIACGKYIMFIDSDDYIKQNMIEEMYNGVINNNADTCIGGYCRIKNNNEIVMKNALSGKVIEKNDIIDKLLIKMMGKLPNGSDYTEMSVWKTLFSKEVIDKKNIRFPSEREMISEDIIFDIEYYTSCEKIYISENCGYCYCDNEGSLTMKYNEKRFNLQKKLLNTLNCILKERKLLDKAKIRIENNFICNVRHCMSLEVKFRKQNSIRICLNNIKKMCEDEAVINILDNFPNNEVPLLPRIFNTLIKKKKVFIIYPLLLIK